MTDLLLEIASLASELTDRRPHTERIHEWDHNRNRKTRTYSTVQDGLLQQLADAVIPSIAGEQGRSVPKSRPPLLTEALSRKIEIGYSVNGWIHTTQLENRVTTEANIRALVGHAPQLENQLQRHLWTDLRRWRSWAAVLTGWDLPPLTPYVPCPKLGCGTTGSLRVIPDRKTGYCNSCGTVWDDSDGSIGVLAEYIKSEGAKPKRRLPIGSTVQGHGGWAERKA